MNIFPIHVTICLYTCTTYTFLYYILAPKLNTVMTHGKKPGPFLDQCILIHTNPYISVNNKNILLLFKNNSL
jgi:hypothetical protein